MATLMAGCDLDQATGTLIDDLIALKKRVTKRQEEGACVPVLDELIASEQKIAKEWLNSTDKPAPQPDLIGEAEAIHRGYVRALG